MGDEVVDFKNNSRHKHQSKPVWRPSKMHLALSQNFSITCTQCTVISRTALTFPYSALPSPGNVQTCPTTEQTGADANEARQAGGDDTTKTEQTKNPSLVVSHSYSINTYFNRNEYNLAINTARLMHQHPGPGIPYATPISTTIPLHIPCSIPPPPSAAATFEGFGTERDPVIDFVLLVVMRLTRQSPAGPRGGSKTAGS